MVVVVVVVVVPSVFCSAFLAHPAKMAKVRRRAIKSAINFFTYFLTSLWVSFLDFPDKSILFCFLLDLSFRFSYNLSQRLNFWLRTMYN